MRASNREVANAVQKDPVALSAETATMEYARGTSSTSPMAAIGLGLAPSDFPMAYYARKDLSEEQEEALATTIDGSDAEGAAATTLAAEGEAPVGVAPETGGMALLFACQNRSSLR